MAAPRIDLFGFIHRGVRALFFEATTTVARTDFANPAEAAAAAVNIHRLLEFLREHAHLEDVQVWPLLASYDRALAEEFGRDHAALEDTQSELAIAANRAESASVEERAEAGRALASVLHRLLAAHLVHMDREEREANRVLWANLNDEELGRIHGRIAGSMPPARHLEWMSVTVPQLNPALRRAVLAGMPEETRAKLVARLGAVDPVRSVS